MTRFDSISGRPRLCSSIREAILRSSFIVMLVAAAPCAFSGESLDSLVQNATNVSLAHLRRSVIEIRDSTAYPTYGTKNLRWQVRNAGDWVSGFYPGCLWYAYELSGDAQFSRWAERWTASLEPEKSDTGTHDLGFKFMCSYGNGLRLGKNPAYAPVLLTAAKTLANRYNPVVGALGSNWDSKPSGKSFPVIIDIMMNLDLLFWGSEHGGGQSMMEYAVRHAETTCRDFLRADGGTYHIVRYDPLTGRIINRGTIQGDGDETTWSRGQAWGIYGMVEAYRHTRREEFLRTAMRLADYFLAHLPPDRVSPWDFQSANIVKDVSATCITTSALFELARYLPGDSLRVHYRTEAEGMLRSLCSAPFFLGDRNTACLLDHSTQHLPAKSNVDVPSIFADYYFLEAILRYHGLAGGGDTRGSSGGKTR